jgi:uncharacterized membrane protein YdcZ (DUF606 family)
MISDNIKGFMAVYTVLEVAEEKRKSFWWGWLGGFFLGNAFMLTILAVIGYYV